MQGSLGVYRKLIGDKLKPTASEILVDDITHLQAGDAIEIPFRHDLVGDKSNDAQRRFVVIGTSRQRTSITVRPA